MPSLFSQYKYRVMAVYIAGLFIQVIDGTVVNIAVPTLAEEFGVDATDVDWAIIGFYIALAVVIPISGYLADRFGTKRLFLLALSGFVITSALCGTAQTLNQLIIFRVLQGLVAGMITPIGSAMLYRAFPLEERARASAAVIGVVVIAPAIGPALGGGIIETLNWRWIFFINIPIGGAAAIAGTIWLKEEVIGTSGRIDWLGMILAGTGLGTLLFGISEGPNRGWSSPVVVACTVVGVVLLTVLVFVETRIPDPALTLRLYKNRLFRAINLVAAPVYMGFFSLIFLLPVFLQKVGDHAPFITGLTVSGQAVGVVLASQLGGRWLYPRVGPRPLLIFGCVATMVSSLWFATIDETTALPAITAMTFVRGFFMGFVFIAIQTACYAQISLPDMGRATSLFNTQRQAAVAVGVAIVATVLSALVFSLDAPTDGGAPTAERVDAFQTAFLVSAALFALATAASFFVHNEDAAGTMAKPKPKATQAST